MTGTLMNVSVTPWGSSVCSRAGLRLTRRRQRTCSRTPWSGPGRAVNPSGRGAADHVDLSNHGQSRDRSGAEPSAAHAVSPVRPVASVDERWDRLEGAVEVRAALVRLSAVDRAVLVMREVVGCSVPEIADLVGCSPATAQKRVQRARVRLADVMTDAEGARVSQVSDTCRAVHADAVAYLDGVLGAARMGELDDHVCRCVACPLTMQALSLVREAVPDDRISVSTTGAVRRALRTQELTLARPSSRQQYTDQAEVEDPRGDRHETHRCDDGSRRSFDDEQADDDQRHAGCHPGSATGR